MDNQNERIDAWRTNFLASAPVEYGLFLVRMKYEDLTTYVRNQKNPKPEEVRCRLDALKEYIPRAKKLFGISTERLLSYARTRKWNMEYLNA